MRAIAHGWTPSRMKSPPSRAVAQEFVEADKKYSGGFAENRYAKGGLSAMNEVDSGSERQRPLNQLHFQRGGRRGGRRTNGGGGTSTTTYSPPPAPEAPTFPWGSEAGTTQEMLDRMGYSGPMGYIGVVSGLRQAGWTPAPGGDPEDLRNRMWYPPEQTLTGEGGPGGPSGPPPRIIPTEPASYVGASAEEQAALKESSYRDKLRAHQGKIDEIFGGAEGGHVNYYQGGGEVRPGHAEGANPHDPAADPAAYKYWETRFHKDPPPPPEPAAVEEEDGGMLAWLRGMFIDDPETANVEKAEEYLESIDQARGGRVGYQLGGLAIAAPAGGVPPWISPTGTGPEYMEEPQGYQFGGIADRFNPPAPAAAPVGMAAPQAGIPNRAQQARGRLGPSRGGRFGRGRPQGGLAQVGGLPPGIDPRAVAANPEGYRAQVEAQRAGAQRGFQGMAARGEMGPGTSRQYRMSADEYRGATDAQRRAAEMMGGPGGGSMQGAIMAPRSPEEAEWQRRNYGPNEMDKRIMGLRRGMGRDPNPMPGGGGFGDYDPRIRTGPSPNIGRPGWDPIGDMGPITGGGGGIPPWKRPPGGRRAPPPGKYPMGDERGPGIPGGPMVPPNQRGYLQRQRMMNRPPSGPVGGGGGNRVGMADQQGALSRAMQRGTGRAPPSRRFGRGRAGAGRGFQQP